MDDQTAQIGAQEIDHEDPKLATSSGLEEKVSEKNSTGSSSHSVDSTVKGEKLGQQDVETAQEEKPPSPVKVPRAKRRGLFGRFTILAEIEEPKHYPRRTKWFITFNVALAAVAAPLGSAILFRETSHVLLLMSNS